jgi:hypothetical protein
MLSYCYFILCLTTDWLIERSDRMGMNTVTCPVKERTFCPYVPTRFGDNPNSRQNGAGPLPGDSGRCIQLTSHIQLLQILITQGRLSPACLHGTVFTHKDYYRF